MNNDKEIKIEDFIDQDEFNNMSKKEREIYEKAFLLNKDKVSKTIQKIRNLNNEIVKFVEFHEQNNCIF